MHKIKLKQKLMIFLPWRNECTEYLFVNADFLEIHFSFLPRSCYILVTLARPSVCLWDSRHRFLILGIHSPFCFSLSALPSSSAQLRCHLFHQDFLEGVRVCHEGLPGPCPSLAFIALWSVGSLGQSVSFIRFLHVQKSPWSTVGSQ